MTEITWRNLGNVPLVECSACGATVRRQAEPIHEAWHIATRSHGLGPRAEPKFNDELEHAFLNATCTGFFYDRGGWIVLTFVNGGKSYDVRLDPKFVALDGVRPDMPQGIAEPGQ